MRKVRTQLNYYCSRSAQLTTLSPPHIGSLRFAKACNSMGTILTTKSKYMSSTSKNSQLQIALKYLYKSYQIREFKLHESHDDVIVTLYGIASAYEEMGEVEEARKVQEFILERMGVRIDEDGNVVEVSDK